MSHFEWNDDRSQAAVALAEGKNKSAVAREVGVDRRTISRWLLVPEFSEEVDRLSNMIGIASRAARLRIANRIVAQRVQDDKYIHSERDLLDWLKYAQSETDGIKLDLAAVASTYTAMAGERQG